ncbi:RICIN domain-containing protein [Kribbella sp. NPDC020789]
MRPPRIPGTTPKTSSSRFAETFARRPDLPRVSRMPDRRAWSATLLVTGFVAGIAFAVPALMHSGGGNSPVYAADVPLVDQRTPVPAPGTSITTVLKPGVTVTLPPATVTVPGKNTTMVVTVPGKNLTATVTLPPAVTTATATTTTTATATTTKTTSTTTTVQVPADQKTAESINRPPAQQPMTLKSDDSKRCIDVKDAGDGVGRDGTPLIAWECTGNANQSWAFQPDGTIRSLNLCMDVANAQSADGTRIQVANCNGGWAQKFQLNDKRELVNPDTGKCVTAESGDKGAGLVLRSCIGAPVQKWHKP